MVVSFGGRARAPVVIHYSLLCYCWWVLERYDLSHSVCLEYMHIGYNLSRGEQQIGIRPSDATVKVVMMIYDYVTIGDLKHLSRIEYLKNSLLVS